ncbi:hypothetical protein JCM3775_002855 [Rhodotorula graminis]
MSTALGATEYRYPPSVHNGEGDSLVERLERDDVKTYSTSRNVDSSFGKRTTLSSSSEPETRETSKERFVWSACA